MTIISIIAFLITMAAQWRYFQKMGREGWEGIVPLYNTYVLFEMLYGNGWQMLYLLIPFYNIYIAVKLNIDLAHAFNKSTGFGVGLVFLPFIFACILAFGDAVYGDGTHERVGDDAISRSLDRMSDSFNGAAAPERDPDALNKIAELAKLHDAGVITDEEFAAKKKELLDRT